VSGAAQRPSNGDIAGRLRRIADLLELSGANAFRVRAYRAAAETIAAHEAAVADMPLPSLLALQGVGKDIARAVRDLVEQGEIAQLAALEREVPVGLLDVVRVPGVGPKRAAAVWRALGVTGLDDLEREGRAGRLARLPGFGDTSQAKILAGIERVRARAGRVRLVDAEAVAVPLAASLAAIEGVVRLDVAGSYRRGRETVGGLDLLAQAEDAEPVMAALRDGPGVAAVRVGDARTTRVALRSGLEVGLRVVGADAYGAALLFATGSPAHTLALRSRAEELGLRLTEEGLFEVADDGEPGRPVARAHEEEEVYRALGLAFVPAELREGRGEVAAAAEGALPQLVTLRDVRGDLHLHTTWSDGSADIGEMVAACSARGYDYLAITDHSQALRMTGGLDAAKLARQWEALDAFEAAHDGITILRGLEVDIGRDGRLDLDEAWLARLDIVIASVHSAFDLAPAAQTARVVAALEHPQVNVLAHPTGRVLGRRDPYELDLDEVFAAAAAHGVAVELNAAPQRLDLGDVDLMRAVAAGCSVVIDTDAHGVAGLDDMRYGVITARRAWLTPAQVVNTWPLERVRAFLAKG
jgi:DNA polymerase (family X)